MFKRYTHQPWLATCYFPEEGSDVQNIDVPSPSDDDIDVLNTDDDEDEETDDSSDDSSEDDEEEQEVEDENGEEEKEDDKEDDEEEEKPVKGKAKKEEADPENVTFQEIKAKYPNIYKEFPGLRRVIGQQQEYSKIFSTPAEAQESVNKAEAFDGLSEAILQGNFKTLAAEMQAADPESVRKLAKNFLPTLREIDEKAYWSITGPIVVELIASTYQNGIKNKNNNLKNSAIHIWNSLGLEGEPQMESRREDPRDKEFEQRNADFERARFNDAHNIVLSTIIESVESQLGRALDPKNEMKPKVRKALVRDLRLEMDAEIAKDSAHMSKIKRLWNQAQRSAYSRNQLSSISAAYLERVKSLIPKKVAEVSGTDKRKQKIPERVSTGNGQSQKSTRVPSARNIDWKKTSDEDLLNGKTTLKGSK